MKIFGRVLLNPLLWLALVPAWLEWGGIASKNWPQTIEVWLIQISIPVLLVLVATVLTLRYLRQLNVPPPAAEINPVSRVPQKKMSLEFTWGFAVSFIFALSLAGSFLYIIYTQVKLF